LLVLQLLKSLFGVTNDVNPASTRSSDSDLLLILDAPDGENVNNVIYTISDEPLTEEEWAAKYCS
jgi:hypothetical protein